MVWSAEDVGRHNKKAAKSKRLSRIWVKTANRTLKEDPSDEGKAIRIANFAVGNALGEVHSSLHDKLIVINNDNEFPPKSFFDPTKERKLTPFHGGRSTPRITKKHVPLVWGDLHTRGVHARSPHGVVHFFGDLYNSAHKHAKTNEHHDLRIAPAPHGLFWAKNGGASSDGPVKGQAALWGIPNHSLKKDIQEH